MIASNEIIATRKDSPSGTIVLQRPECRNAISRAMVEMLIEAIEDFQQERAVRALILTGSGDSFSSGTDLAELQKTRDEKDALEIWHRDASRFQELIELMLRFPKPIICAVDGVALGTGLALVLASDLVLATPKSQFGLPEGKRGLVAGVSAPLLNFRAGVGSAASLLYTGKNVTAEDAHRMGIVHQMVDANLIWASAYETAKACASNSIQSLQMTKQLMNETVGEQLFTQLSIGAANMATARTTDAAIEGVDAFLDKKDVDWK